MTGGPCGCQNSWGVLTAACPPELVDDVLAECGCVEERRRRLPARLVTYSVLAMCLFPWASYEEVLRLLSSGWCLPQAWRVPNKSSISRCGRSRNLNRADREI